MRRNSVISQRDIILSQWPIWKMLLAGILGYSVAPALLIFDIVIIFYQATYFSLIEIPKIERSEYVVLDRWDLSQLNLIEKINCVYCEYANGIAAWGKAVINQTELYSCAIKHGKKALGQEHQEKFYERSEFS